MSDTLDYLDGLDYPDDALEQSFAPYLGTMGGVEAEIAAKNGPTTTNRHLERLLEVEPRDYLRPGLETPCMGAGNPDFWFSNDKTERALAVRECYQCPVRAECLKWAKKTKQQGIWGGVPLLGGCKTGGNWK